MIDVYYALVGAGAVMVPFATIIVAIINNMRVKYEYQMVKLSDIVLQNRELKDQIDSMRNTFNENFRDVKRELNSEKIERITASQSIASAWSKLRELERRVNEE
ncbi:hypothetical protein ACTND8_07845 [Atopobiaceae bacterium HCP3S3_F7]|jgi:hypothetical protein|uniref:hypothetical protein n=1 Tax=Actinomycetota TaxID=201174 RepID=UPI003F89BD27